MPSATVYSRQRGAALILALVVTAIVVLLGVTVGNDFQVTFKRVENSLYSQQARSLLLGMESLMRSFVARGVLPPAGDPVTQPGIDNLNQLMARFPIEENGTVILVNGRISDEQARLNLNTLGTPPAPGADYTTQQLRLLRLFQLLPLDPVIDPLRAEELLNAVLDWLDTAATSGGFDTTRPGGGESFDYQELEPPFRSADRGRFTSVSELRLLNGFDEAIYRAILPYVTVFGDGTINLNTASETLLRTLNEDQLRTPLDAVQVSAILQLRERPEGITALADLASTTLPFLVGQPGLTVGTDTIRLTARTLLLNRDYSQYTIMQRAPATNTITVLARSDFYYGF